MQLIEHLSQRKEINVKSACVSTGPGSSGGEEEEGIEKEQEEMQKEGGFYE